MHNIFAVLISTNIFTSKNFIRNDELMYKYTFIKCNTIQKISFKNFKNSKIALMQSN